ncbi:unnamed protein product [Schistosoma margrebowiei]|uniref:Vezatin domain-containing protein n=1 Tax=Schistosoma margrebowiei TaxID=48269 RepID=A0A183LH43_9TREM|nr:unnamed protein product [Schistosoma margrebowiei]VDO57125.1 unnamed protein product [Schistosoma margrebowiei]
MEEEETYLPENHPLQQYFREIGVPDVATCEISKRPTITTTTIFPMKKFAHILSYLKCINPFDFTLYFGFDLPLTRYLLLQIISLIKYSDLITVENKPVVEYIYSVGNNDQVDSRCCFVIFSILCGFGLSYSTQMIFIFLLVILCLRMSNVLFLMVSKYHIADSLKQMKKFSHRSHLIVLFLQDLNTRRYFGPKIVDKNTFKLFPLIYHQAYNFMRAYLIEVIDFSVKLEKLIGEHNSEIPLEMSTLELIQLKCDIKEKPKDPSIENLRMFCELLKLLISDLLVKLSFSFCRSRRDTFHLLRLIMSVWKWDYFLTRIRNEFNKLNELHSMILNGKLIHNDARTAKECVSGESEVKNLYKRTEARITHELLLHLLVSLEHANNLKSYVEQNCNTSFVSNETFSNLVSLIRCQLNASLLFLNELDNAQTADNVDISKENIETTVDFLYCRDGISSSKDVLKAVDPIVEDDVLEDIAVGDSSSRESEAEYENVDCVNSLKNPSSGMHVTVLKELKNVISHRRVIMQEREECALKRRLQIECPDNKKPSLSTNRVSLISEKELQTQFVLSNSLESNCASMDDKLLEFFPTPLCNSACEYFKKSRTGRRNLKCNVLKRNSIFLQLSSTNVHENDRSSNCSDPIVLKNVSQSKNPPDNKFLQCSTLANALMNQRKLLGLATEDCFTGIGSGEMCVEISEENHTGISS